MKFYRTSIGLMRTSFETILLAVSRKNVCWLGYKTINNEGKRYVTEIFYLTHLETFSNARSRPPLKICDWSILLTREPRLELCAFRRMWSLECCLLAETMASDRNPISQRWIRQHLNKTNRTGESKTVSSFDNPAFPPTLNETSLALILSLSVLDISRCKVFFSRGITTTHAEPSRERIRRIR